jgi:hypothetical protein
VSAVDTDLLAELATKIEHLRHERTIVVAPEDEASAGQALEMMDLDPMPAIRSNPSVRPGTAYVICPECLHPRKAPT